MDKETGVTIILNGLRHVNGSEFQDGYKIVKHELWFALLISASTEVSIPLFPLMSFNTLGLLSEEDIEAFLNKAQDGIMDGIIEVLSGKKIIVILTRVNDEVEWEVQITNQTFKGSFPYSKVADYL